MDRIVGIDYGRKRVGVAVSDPLGIFASALDTVHSAKIIEYLEIYSRKENVVRFVVGYPVNMDGAPSEAAKDVDAFLKKFDSDWTRYNRDIIREVQEYEEENGND